MLAAGCNIPAAFNKFVSTAKVMKNGKPAQTEAEIKAILTSYCSKERSALIDHWGANLLPGLVKELAMRQSLKNCKPVMFFDKESFEESVKYILYARSLALYTDFLESDQTELIKSIVHSSEEITEDMASLLFNIRIYSNALMYFEFFFPVFDVTELERYRVYVLMAQTVEYNKQYNTNIQDAEIYQSQWFYQEKTLVDEMIETLRKSNNTNLTSLKKFHCLVVLEKYSKTVNKATEYIDNRNKTLDDEPKQIFIDDDYIIKLQNTFFGFLDPQDIPKAMDVLRGKRVDSKVFFRDDTLQLVKFFMQGLNENKIHIHPMDLKAWLVNNFFTRKGDNAEPKALSDETVKKYIRDSSAKDPNKKYQRDK